MISKKFDLYCKRCKNYQFDNQKGILCGLTNSKPKFIDVCHDFVLDQKRDKRLSSIQRIHNDRRMRAEAGEEYSQANIQYSYFESQLPLVVAVIALITIILIAIAIIPAQYRSLSIIVFSIAFNLLSLKLARQNERLLVFRHGKFHSIVGPGLALIIPFIDKYKRVNLDKYIPEWRDLSTLEVERRVNEHYFANVLK